MEFISKLWSTIVSYATTISIFDVLDVLIVAYIIYKIIQLIKETRAAQLIKGIFLLLILLQLSELLKLNTINFILRNTMQLGFMAIIVVFQPELRRILERVGRSKIARFNPLSMETEDRTKNTLQVITNICEAIQILSQYKIGALILFEREIKLGDIINTGTQINADITSQIIVNIFYPKAPLHDGAMVIRDNKICAAGCLLPLSQNQEISKELGTRHRAALGITENSDAFVVVVSEETGKISLAKDAAMKRNLTPETLKIALIQEFLPHQNDGEKKKYRFRNLWKVKDVEK